MGKGQSNIIHNKVLFDKIQPGKLDLWSDQGWYRYIIDIRQRTRQLFSSNYVSYYSIKPDDVGTQKNRLIETILLKYPQHRVIRSNKGFWNMQHVPYQTVVCCRDVRERLFEGKG